MIQHLLKLSWVRIRRAYSRFWVRKMTPERFERVSFIFTPEELVLYLNSASPEIQALAEARLVRAGRAGLEALWEAVLNDPRNGEAALQLFAKQADEAMRQEIASGLQWRLGNLYDNSVAIFFLFVVGLTLCMMLFMMLLTASYEVFFPLLAFIMVLGVFCSAVRNSYRKYVVARYPVEALIALNDKRFLGIIAVLFQKTSVLLLDDRERRERFHSVLRQVTANDRSLFSLREMRAMVDIASDSHVSPETAVLILQAIQYVGDIRLLQPLASLRHDTMVSSAVQQAAEECIAYLRAKEAALKDAETLLRSSSPSEQPDTLLRPVQNRPDEEADQLLRPR